MPDFLLELRSEEIPARMQPRAARDLKKLAGDALADAGLAFDEMQTFASPRRLVLHVLNLPEKQEDVTEERRGPRADAPEKAIEGFLKSNNLTRDDLETRKTPKGEFLFAVVERKGAPTADILAPMATALVSKFPWPKSMRWGSGRLRWVRPLHGILCLFGETVLDVQLDGLKSGARTMGHPVMAPQAIEIDSPAHYETLMDEHYVMVDSLARQALIEERARELAETQHYELIEDNALLAEVAGLVEWPVVLPGRIDDEFMSLPEEVLQSEMRMHQKYFSLRDPDSGRLAPAFLLVADMEAADGGAAIVAGNERVLRARLSDAAFFWDQDRRTPLEDLIKKLDGVIFHAGLGTMGQKAARICALAKHLTGSIKGADAEKAGRAGRLAKADLVSEMVGEFPDLQGIMGGYYAREQGEDAAVAQAIAEHYSPAGPNDACPDAPLSIAVALADKIDTLTGFYAKGETPTGSRDPFALRRAAQSVIRLILENKLQIKLLALFTRAYNLYGDQGIEGFKKDATLSEIEALDQLLSFIAQRLNVHLRDQGARHDLVAAIFYVEPREDDLLRLLKRIDALAGFLDSDDGANLLTAYKRAANIVRIEEEKEKNPGKYDGRLADDTLLEAVEEKALFDCLEKAGKKITAHLEKDDFTGAMSELAALRKPVDDFFDNVTVNTDDGKKRENRLNLLAAIQGTMEKVAKFSEIEGQRKA